MALINIQLKKNIGYLIVYLVFFITRKLLCIIIEYQFQIRPSDFIFLYLMVLGEIMGGLLIYLYQYNSKKKSQKIKYFRINLIYNKKRAGDNKSKITLLIFLSSFFDIYHFTFCSIYFPINKFSECLDFRLSGIQTISAALIFIFLLKYKMKQHHKVSLIVLGAGLFLTFVIDVIFKKDNITIGEFFFVYFCTCFNGFCFSINNSVEKYLVDIDYMNPFQILLFEGLFGILFSILASISPRDPFNDIRIQFQKKETGRIILIIFLLFLYFIFSMIISAYKVYANIIFLPMTVSLIKYILNPLFNIYFFVMKLDFNNNYWSFFLSEIVCIIMSFFGCVYNEYIILSCFNLDQETEFAIEKRANSFENIPLVDINESGNYAETLRTNSFYMEKYKFNNNVNDLDSSMRSSF